MSPGFLKRNLFFGYVLLERPPFKSRIAHR